ncbi:hypothetical protein Tco_0858937 [Tanacetum coccineum]|uniref:Uncharacterized protein n=1 Tax=Tanacetum coccineum TaxID=301880 RepID=A0ABQ5BAK3_9ASTR
MANVIPPNHVDDLPVVEPNQPDVVPVIPEPVLVDEDEDPEEEEIEEEEEPQEEEDMDIYDEEDKNEPELTFPYEETNPLNPSPPASDSEPEDVIEVEDTVEPEDETVPASVHECDLVWKKERLQWRIWLERAECKKLKKELEEARIMPPKYAPLTQAAVRRMIKESIDAAIATERARQANAGNNASGSEQARGQVTAPVVLECTFAGFMKCNPDNFRDTEGAVEFRR